MLAWHPDAVAAEPFTPAIRQPSVPPPPTEEDTAIRGWLALIEETDPAMIADVIERCQRDAGARAYFLGRAAAELPKARPPGVLVRCIDCLHQQPIGHQALIQCGVVGNLRQSVAGCGNSMSDIAAHLSRYRETYRYGGE